MVAHINLFKCAKTNIFRFVEPTLTDRQACVWPWAYSSLIRTGYIHIADVFDAIYIFELKWSMNRLSSKGKTPKFDPLAFKNYLSDQNQNYCNWLRRRVLQVCQVGWRLHIPSSPHLGVKYKHFFCMYVYMYVCIYVYMYVCMYTFFKCLSS